MDQITSHKPVATETETGHQQLTTDPRKTISQNEPKPDLTPQPSTTSDSQITAREAATDLRKTILQNEPNPDATPEPSMTSELVTSH